MADFDKDDSAKDDFGKDKFAKDKFRDSLRDSIHSDIRDRLQEKRDRMDEKFRRRAARRQNDRGEGVIWGAVICVVGIVLLLDHLGYIFVDHLWRFWPLIPMGIGAAHMAEPGKRVWGGFVVLVGALFLLDSLGVMHFRWDQLWPLAIIGVGGLMIWNSLETQRRRRSSATTTSTSNSESAMNAHAIFGGIERRITVQDFKFGRVSAVFGGVELDFHEAEMEGDTAELEVNAIFGGAELRVPEHWRVEAQNQTIFGGFSDSTRFGKSLEGDNPVRKTLIISGSTMFGGIEVKN
jgi:predicted membrane protein